MIKTPVCIITANNKPLNELISSRIISVTVTDNRANEADELSIVLDDSDGALELPKRGVKLNCKMGYLGEDSVTLPGLIYEEYGFGSRFALDDLASMADTGQGFVLMDGSGYLYGVYVIDSIDETKSFLVDNGVPRKVDYTLKLSRADDDRIENQAAPELMDDSV